MATDIERLVAVLSLDFEVAGAERSVKPFISYQLCEAYPGIFILIAVNIGSLREGQQIT